MEDKVLGAGELEQEHGINLIRCIVGWHRNVKLIFDIRRLNLRNWLDVQDPNRVRLRWFKFPNLNRTLICKRCNVPKRTLHHYSGQLLMGLDSIWKTPVTLVPEADIPVLVKNNKMSGLWYFCYFQSLVGDQLQGFVALKVKFLYNLPLCVLLLPNLYRFTHADCKTSIVNSRNINFIRLRIVNVGKVN